MIFTQFFKNDLGDIINGVKGIFNGLIDFVTGIYTADWKRAWGGIVDAFSGIWKTLGSLVQAPLNEAIGMINALIGGIESGLNAVIKAANSISFEMLRCQENVLKWGVKELVPFLACSLWSSCNWPQYVQKLQ